MSNFQLAVFLWHFAAFVQPHFIVLGSSLQLQIQLWFQIVVLLLLLLVHSTVFFFSIYVDEWCLGFSDCLPLVGWQRFSAVALWISDLQRLCEPYCEACKGSEAIKPLTQEESVSRLCWLIGLLVITCISDPFDCHTLCRFGWITVKPHYYVMDHPSHCHPLRRRNQRKLHHHLIF